MSSPKGYSRGQIALHWVVAAVILAQFLFSDAISRAFRTVMEGGVPAFDPLILSHVLGGFAVLGFALWRLVLRKTRGVPDLPDGSGALVRIGSAVTHIGLYALMVLLPLSGAVAWFAGVGPAGGAHEVLKALLMLLVGLHVLAALWHQFWLKDGLMLRMKRAAQ